MKMIQFSQTFWHCVNGVSVPQFEAGKQYPADDAEAQRCVVRGIAEEVDVPDAVPEPEGVASEPAADAPAAAPEPEPAAEPAAAPAPAAKAKK